LTKVRNPSHRVRHLGTDTMKPVSMCPAVQRVLHLPHVCCYVSRVASMFAALRLRIVLCLTCPLTVCSCFLACASSRPLSFLYRPLYVPMVQLFVVRSHITHVVASFCVSSHLSESRCLSSSLPGCRSLGCSLDRLCHSASIMSSFAFHISSQHAMSPYVSISVQH